MVLSDARVRALARLEVESVTGGETWRKVVAWLREHHAALDSVMDLPAILTTNDDPDPGAWRTSGSRALGIEVFVSHHEGARALDPEHARGGARSERLQLADRLSRRARQELSLTSAGDDQRFRSFVTTPPWSSLGSLSGLRPDSVPVLDPRRVEAAVVSVRG